MLKFSLKNLNIVKSSGVFPLLFILVLAAGLIITFMPALAEDNGPGSEGTYYSRNIPTISKKPEYIL